MLRKPKVDKNEHEGMPVETFDSWMKNRQIQKTKTKQSGTENQ